MSPTWGPFHGPGDALNHVGPFINSCIGPSVGVCWAGGGKLYPLRKPVYDGAGFGEVAIVEWHIVPPPPPPPAPPATIGGRFMAFLNGIMEQQGKAQMLQGEIAMAQGRAISGAFSTLWDRAWNKNRSDTEGVILDVLAVGLSIGFMAPPFGLIALVGGVALLGMDGYIWGQEMAGEDERAEETKHTLKLYRWGAAIACLPDALWGLGKVAIDLPKILESVGELKAARAGEEAKAWRAQTGSGNSGRAAITADANSALQARKADMARRFATLAENARKRAAAKALELGKKWAELGQIAVHEAPPRLMLGETFRLMYNELTPKDKQEAVQILRNYAFHVVSVHK